MVNGSARIFLAEDNTADVYLIREALDETGMRYSLEVAENGEVASAKIQQFGACGVPDLIVLDLNLPRLTGAELLAIVRGQEDLKDTPVIIFTSSDSPYDREQTSRLGATYYIRKPSTLDEFLAVGAEFARMIR